MLDFKPTPNWLETFPRTWITPVCLSSFPIITGYILKQCLIVHQVYPLPGRKAYDEEFLFISPTNCVLDNYPIYRKAKIIPGSFLELLRQQPTTNVPWSSPNTVLRDFPLISFIIAKSNYGHALLDFLPEAYSVAPDLIAQDGMIFVGADPNTTILQALSDSVPLLSPVLRLNPLPDVTYSSFNIYKVSNLLITPFNSRADKVAIIQDKFRPRIQDLPPPTSSTNLLVNRKHNKRLIIDDLLQDELRDQGFSTVDLTTTNFNDTVSLLRSANRVLIPLGAECSNLVFANRYADIRVFVNSQSLSSPFYINAIADTILPITSSNLSICPLDPVNSVTSQMSMTDCPLLLKSGSF